MGENNKVIEELENLAEEESMQTYQEKKSHRGLGIGLIAVGAIATVAAVIAKKCKKKNAENNEEDFPDEFEEDLDESEEGSDDVFVTIGPGRLDESEDK